MARILFTTIPITGHVRPGLPVARELVSAGHDVLWYTGKRFERWVSRTGAGFTACAAVPGADDPDVDLLESMDGQRSGLSGFRRIIRELFVEPVPAYAAELGPLIDEFRPDVVVADHCFLAGPMLARMRGLGSVVYVVGPLAVSSVDTAPSGTGLAPSSSALGRLRNRALQWAIANLAFRDVQQTLHRVATEIGFTPLPDFLTDWTVRIADRYLVAAVPEFEYPRRDLPAAVEFVGPLLPEGVDDWTPPDWWPDVAQARRTGRPVVLVTQGTAATDPSELIQPTLAALADLDALVVVTTAAAVPDAPANARITRFTPYSELLPLTDLMITNGGYGGVQMSVAFGVPLVVAGRSEDKMEVNQRVRWSGAGISLNTSRPAPRRVRAAVDRVLGQSRYRTRARELAAAYARDPGASLAADAIVRAVPSHR
jgi:MGT family glycosyltransferase